MVVFNPLKLKETCLNVIASDFDGFLSVLDSEDYLADKHLIRQLFSNELFKKVKIHLKEKHASFFINSRLKKLDLNRFSPDDMDAVIKILRNQGHGILSLILSNRRRSYQRATVLHFAHSLPNSLTSLRLYAIPYSRKILSIVVNTCQNLQELRLNSCGGVTDNAIVTEFCNSEHIKKNLLKLDLRETNVTDKGIIWILRYCLNLNELLHNDVGTALSHIYDAYVKNDKFSMQKYNLRSLFLKGRQLNAARQLCPYIKSLCCFISTQSEMNACLEFEKLKEVKFYFVTFVSLSSFFEARGSKLESIKIEGEIIVPIQLLIQCCPKLKCLELMSVFEINVRGFNIAECFFQNLKILRIGIVVFSQEIRDIDAFISYCPKIETLDIFGICDFSDSFIYAISRINCLKNFYIRHAFIREPTLRKIIVSSPHIKHIFVLRCLDITSEECQNLAQLNNGLSISFKKLVIPFAYF